MLRRQALAALCTAGFSGCLRLTEDSSSSAAGDDAGVATSASSPRSEKNEGTASGGVLSSTSEAIEYARRFANSGSVSSVEPYSGDGPELIQHGGGWGSSYGSSDAGGAHTSADIRFEAVSDSIAFGGDSNRSLRIRNLTTGAAVTFEPDSTERLRATEWDIDPETEAVLPSSIGVDVRGSDDRLSLLGTWSGDTDIFRTQTFGTYVVDLLEGGTRIGGTAGKPVGTRYHWGAMQTPDAMYVTRQPSVHPDWHAALIVGQSPYEPQAQLMAEHRVEDDVFRVDLTDLDLEPGQYDWSLLIASERPVLRHRAIELSPLNTSLIVQ